MRLALDIKSKSRSGVEGSFALAAALELHGVLLPLPALGAEPAEFAEAEAARLRQMAADAGVVIAGLANVMAGAEHRLAGGDTSRAAALARLQAVVRLCTELGTRLACFKLPAWEMLRSRLRPDQARALAAEVLRRCGPLAESRRVTLCVCSGDAHTRESFTRSVDHPNVRLACDAPSLKLLAQPVRDARLVRAQRSDDPRRLGRLLGALGYTDWLSLHLGNKPDLTETRAWLKEFRAATGIDPEK